MAVWAQSFLGTITGTVVDATGAVVQNAKVVLTEVNTGVQRSSATNSTGNYTFADLTPGRYTVAISAPGFKELRSGELVLTGNQNRRFDGRLELGAASETVEVSAAPPTLNTENAQIAGVESREELINSPTNTRSTISLFMVNSFNYQGEGSSYSLGGLRGSNTNFTIDGTTSNANLFGNQSGPQTEVSFESVRDMKLLASNNTAEYSKVGTVFIETRSGENEFHGSAFYTQSNNALNARSFFASSRQPGTPTQHQFGGSLGGPVFFPKLYNGKDKTFFYFTFEQNRYPGSAFFVADVPTPAFRNGDFSALLPGIVITDPTTGRPFNNNMIPSNRISQVSQAVQNFFFPAPNLGAANSFTGNWGSYINQSSYVNRFSGRIDHQVSEHDSISGRFTARNDPQPFSADNPMATTGHFQYRRNINAYISETHLFSPYLVNEFRVGFSRDHSTLSGEHNGNQLLGQFGILGATPNTTTGAPEFDFQNFSNTYEFPDYEYTSQALEILDNVSLTHAKHSFKMGTMIRRNDPNISDNPGCDFGCYGFDGSTTGFDYADFLLGIPSTSNRNFRAPNAYFRWTNAGFYAQDEYKVNARLTLNLGVRWEYNQQPYEKHDLIYTFNPATDGLVVPNQNVLRYIQPTYPANIPIQTAQQAGFPSPSLLRSNWHDIGPRVSFAYLPFAGSTLVIRGGYGIYYSPVVGELVGSGTLQGGPFASFQSYTNQVVNGVPQFQFPTPFGGSAEVPTLSVDSFTKNLRSPYVQQWNVTVERELVHKLVGRVTYRGFRMNQIAYTRDLNLPPASASPAQEFTYFPYSSFYKVAWTENGGIQKLSAVDVSVERKFSSGLMFQSQYTWGRNMSDTGNDGERATPEDPYDRARDYGNVGFMPRQRWVTDVYYELPFGRGKRYASTANRLAASALGGWGVSAILVEQTGQFLTPTYSGVDVLHNRNRSGRADCVADPYPSNQGIQQWFVRSAFAVPAPGTWGNCQRDVLTGPGMNDLNLGLFKTFYFSERMRLQFRGTATNALNHPIFSNPNTTITSGGFGRITGVLGQNSNRASLGAAGYRIIQIGARIDF